MPDESADHSRSMTEMPARRADEAAPFRPTRSEGGYVGRGQSPALMSRRLTHSAAAVLAALACGLGVAACGGGASAEEQAAVERAQARWQTGVPKWRTDMVRALNEISLMLSNATTVGRLQAGDARAVGQLTRFEHTLEGCAAAIRRLGPAPGELQPVRVLALRTCRNLANGARLVHDGVADWQAGRGGKSIDSANLALGNGQNGIEHVRSQLQSALDD
jgi:hypothetical protein